MNIIDSTTYRKQIQTIVYDLPRKKSTIFISGATGLIGSCLADVFLLANHLINTQYKVVVLARDENKLRSRFGYADQNEIIYVVQDIMNPLSIDIPIDYIIHAASNADPIAYSMFPAETLLTNIYGTKNLLEYCRHHAKTRILLTSTFEVYGKIEGQDIYRENDSGQIDINKIRSCYPESKRCAEILLRCYQKEYGINGVIARLCSVYGPTMSKTDSKAHAQFIQNGVAGEEIVLKSKGEQRRTYAYLMDVVSAIIAIIFSGDKDVFNIANDNSVCSIADVANTVAEICGTNVVYDLPSDIEEAGFSRPQNCILDNNRLKGLGWTSRYSLIEGLESTITILKEISC